MTQQNHQQGQHNSESGSVIVFAGHMLDHSPGMTRFPASHEDAVRREIRQAILRVNGLVGYAAAAAGSDILFLEEMDKLGLEVNIILPVEVSDFKEQSVLPCGEEWGTRFDAMLERAARVKVVDRYHETTFANSLEFCNKILTGIARIRAEQLGTSLVPLAVFDGNQPGGVGGTGSVLQNWRRKNLQPEIIGLNNSTPDTPFSLPSFPLDIPLEGGVCHHQYKPILIAHVKSCFSTVFSAKTGLILAENKEHIFWQCSMGDGLFLLFTSLQGAVLVARQIQAMIDQEAWPEYGLSLDAAPCYSHQNQIMDQDGFCADSMKRAAGMKSKSCHISASETFVALCKEELCGDVQFAYGEQVASVKEAPLFYVQYIKE